MTTFFNLTFTCFSALETFFPESLKVSMGFQVLVLSTVSRCSSMLLSCGIPSTLHLLNLSTGIMTIILISLFSFIFLSVYSTNLRIVNAANKKWNTFYTFLRWATNYITNKPLKTFWGFYFRSIIVLVSIIIFLSNFLGLISITFILTSYLSLTLLLSFLAFGSFNIASLMFFETNWLKIFLPYNLPIVTIFPVVALEFVSYTLRVVSLSVRLFANITSGHLLMNVLSGILWSIIIGSATIILSFIWAPFALVLLAVSVIEVFISFLQGFVYLILVKIYSDDSLNVVSQDSDILIDNISFANESTSLRFFADKKTSKKTPAASSKKVTDDSSKVSKKNTRKTSVKETPDTPKAKSNKTSVKPTKESTKVDSVIDDLSFEPLSKEDIKSGKYNLKIDYSLYNENLVKIEKENPREDYGVISRVDGGIIYITGLYNLSVGEIVYFGRKMEQAITLNLERNIAKAAIFSANDVVSQGTPVFRTFRLMKVPVSPKLLGNVIDCLGNSLMGIDIKNTKSTLYRNVDIKALGVIDRKSINEPLVTGVLSIDAMLPIGRGQRELIIGDRQLGKTSLAIDSIISQKNLHVSSWRFLPPVYCIYVAVGQKLSSLARLASQLKKKNALQYTIIVSASAAESAAMQYLVPYVGCAIAEWFLNRNGHALIVYDDLGIQATAYRQLSLLLRRPPGREAYPGDIFYLHSRLLERAAKVNEINGLGSITALPIVETKDGDLSAYIPTNVISITDGQVFLSAAIFYKDIKPAISFTKSVSRVGSKAQTKGMKRLVGLLKRLLALYEDLKYYETLDTGELNDSIKSVLNAGFHLMTIFKQKRFRPYMLQEQFILIWAAIMSFNFVAREESNTFKDFLVRSIAFDSWEIYKLINLGVNTTTNLTNVFVLLNIYYWERCIVYNGANF